jgi:hypothetical protein
MPWVPKMEGGAIPHGTVNKQASQRRQEWWPPPSNLRVGKLVTVAVMRKDPLESGKGALPTWTVNKQAAVEGGCSTTSSSVLGEGKTCKQWLSCPGELQINKACRARWVLSSFLRSAINKASSNSWLTVAGRWVTASDRHSQNYLQTLFFLFLWWEHDSTRTACWRTNWNCIAFELGIFCFVLFFVFSHLMRQWQNYVWDTISRIGGWGTNTKSIYCIWT